MTSILLRTDERTEAIRALRKTYSELQNVVIDPYNWKWVMISLHNAVQGYMVVILRGTNNSMVARAKESLLKAYNEGDAKALVNADLQSFGELFRRIQDSNFMSRLGASKPFIASPDIKEDVESLLYLRNTFIHYLPKALSIDVANGNFLRIVHSSITIISYIRTCGSIYWEEDSFDRSTSETIESIRELLQTLSEAYNAYYSLHNF